MIHTLQNLFTKYKWLLYTLLFVVCIGCSCRLLSTILYSHGSAEVNMQKTEANYQLTQRFDMFMANTYSHSFEDILEIDTVFYLNDSDQVAPEPNQNQFGESSDPAQLQWLLDDAAEILDGQKTLFNTSIKTLDGSSVHYYLDETIFCVTWKQVIHNAVYTISEVKIAHPSQFRRFLSDGQFGSARQYTTSQMASTVNAVVASSGDFYKYRYSGTAVYNGVVERFNGVSLDTCFIEDQGDLLLSPAGELKSKEAAEQYVQDHNVRFSLCFGPILINDYQRCDPYQYDIGEIGKNYARAALCQMDELHYLLVTVNGESFYWACPDIHSFAEVLEGFGVRHAYTLDGGQTATIVMNDQIINQVNYGAERYISDIIYFATAIPAVNKETTGS